THRSADIYDTIHMAREAGFENISIDLMYRLPGQTLTQLQQSLDAALSLDIDHVSIYSLQVEPRTIFYNKMRKGQLPLPDEDEEADMYERLITVLEANGLHHYEISNFAKPGFESRHNHLYWRNDD